MTILNNLRKTTLIAGSTLCLALGVSACGNDSPIEDAAEEVSDGIEDAAQELDPNRSALEKAGEAVEDAGDAVEDATN